MENKCLKFLKAGDEVIVETRDFEGAVYRVMKVEKITPTGFIKVNGVLYKPQSGVSRSGESRIMNKDDDFAKVQLKKYSEKVFAKELCSRFSRCTSVTYGQAQEIKKIMGW